MTERFCCFLYILMFVRVYTREERRKSSMLLTGLQKESEERLLKEFEAKLKAAEGTGISVNSSPSICLCLLLDKAAAAEARARVEEQRANQLQLRLEAGNASSAASSSQVNDLLAKLQLAEDRAAVRFLSFAILLTIRLAFISDAFRIPD